MNTPGAGSIEDRLRRAYEDAAETIRPENIPRHAPVPGQTGARRQIRGRWIQLAIPLGAAAAVLVIALATAAAPQAVRPHPSPASPHTSMLGSAAQGPPKYLVTVPPQTDRLNVISPLTGQITASVSLPVPGGYWYNVAAQGQLTFVVGEDFSDLRSYPEGVTFLYRLRLTTTGAVASLTRIGRAVRGAVLMSCGHA